MAALCAAWLLALWSVAEPRTGGVIDLPAWLQAIAAFVALAVTVFQWWSARADARREKRARQLAGYAVFMNIRAAIGFQAKRMESIRAHASFREMGRYASSMLEAGFELMERQALAVQVADLPKEGVEAVMSAQSAVHGVRQALGGIAEFAKHSSATDADLDSSVEYLTVSLERIGEASEMLRAAVERT